MNEKNLIGKNLNSLFSQEKNKELEDQNHQENNLHQENPEILQKEIENLEQQKKEIEERKNVLEKIQKFKEETLKSRDFTIKNLTNSISLIDNELQRKSSELEIFTETKRELSRSLDRLEKIDVSSWQEENLSLPDELKKVALIIEDGEETLEKSQSILLEKKLSPNISSPNFQKKENSFLIEFQKGLAFNLPLIITLGAIAFLFYSFSIYK